MKLKILSLLAATGLASCSPKTLQVIVENPIPADRSSELVEIDAKKVKSKLNSEIFIIKNAREEEVAYQVTSDGKLIFPAGTAAGETAAFRIEKGTPAAFKPLSYTRFIPERKDDFAWENDRVAFRVYGPALMPVDGPSNGIDIWYKRTPVLIIDKWYKDDLAGRASYHEDHGEGLDDYKVGRTLGAGGMAPYVNGRLWLNQNYETQEILDNGPLRTTFRLTYKDLETDGSRISESRIISLDAGSQLSRVTQAYGTEHPIEVAAGIVTRPGSGVADVSDDKTFLIYNEPKTGKASGVYVALLRPEGWEEVSGDTYTTEKGETHSHTLAITRYTPGKPVTYYTGYGWEKYGFENRHAFEAYLREYVQKLKNPLKVKIR